jgi:hypothetical protein
MVMKYQASLVTLEELCEFIQYTSFVEAYYGKLNSATKLLKHRYHFARRGHGEWSKIKELYFNRVSSELRRVMSQAFKGPKRVYKGEGHI